MRKALALAGVIALATGGLAAVTGPAAAAPAPGPSRAADRALEGHRTAVRASARDAFQVHSSKPDLGGGAVTRYTRTYAGLRVAGGDLVIRTDAAGAYDGSSVGLLAPLTLATTPAVNAAAAARTATAAFEGTLTGTGKPELFVDATSGKGTLSWETVVSGWQPDGQTPSRFHVITDARTGAVVGSYDEIEHVAGAGNSVYSGPVEVQSTATATGFALVDPARGNGTTCDMNNRTSGTCTTFADADNTWGTGATTDRASAAVDAHFGAAATYDYFKNVHGRNGIFGNGAGVPSRVHYGNAYVNAFWDGAQMTYGDGTANAKPLVSLDVAGHEMAHGVTENIVPGGLTYSGESGGLNEATSDIFGSMVEFGADAPGDPGDYDIGEKIDIRGNGTPLRYMYDPTLDGASHGCWATNTRSIDVHYSSGVANHFYFNLAEGTGPTAYGTSRLCGSADPVTGIGRAKAEKIWFRALDAYFVSNTGYVNTAAPGNTARAHSLAAAADLYGVCGTEYRAVQAAWTSVNVAGPDEQCSPTGNDFSLAVSPGAVTVSPGQSATATAGTTLLSGDPEQVTFTATGVPAGVTVTFDPATVPAGGSTTVTVTASAAAAVGVTSVGIKATAASVSRTRPLSIGVGSAPGCAGSSDTDVAVPDNTTVTSAVVITGCTGTPSATSSVDVHITHTFIGDLIVTLIAPDGTGYVLHNRTGGGTDNIDRAYPVDLSGEAPNGAWTLSVRDAASIDTGTLTGWSLSL